MGRVPNKNVNFWYFVTDIFLGVFSWFNCDLCIVGRCVLQMFTWYELITVGKLRKKTFCIDIEAADRFYPKCHLLNYIDFSLSVMYLRLSLDRSTLICDRLGKNVLHYAVDIFCSLNMKWSLVGGKNLYSFFILQNVMLEHLSITCEIMTSVIL
jgi:hypothetical protein